MAREFCSEDLEAPIRSALCYFEGRKVSNPKWRRFTVSLCPSYMDDEGRFILHPNYIMTVKSNINGDTELHTFAYNEIVESSDLEDLFINAIRKIISIY